METWSGWVLRHRTRSTSGSIVEGVSRSGRLVTSAALILWMPAWAARLLRIGPEVPEPGAGDLPAGPRVPVAVGEA